MSVDGEQLYLELVEFIISKGLAVPPDADSMLGDVTREIAEFNNQEF